MNIATRVERWAARSRWRLSALLIVLMILASLPILAITAYAMQEDRERVLNSGFDGYLSKPIDSSLLDAELARIWNNRRVATANLGNLAHAARYET